MIEQDKFHHTEVHCTPANTNDRDNGRLIDVTYIKDLDKHWLDVSLAFMDKMKAVGSHSSCTTQHAAVKSSINGGEIAPPCHVGT